MNDKITVEIKVTNSAGSESTDTWHGNYDKMYNNEWEEITRGLIDEAVYPKEL